MYHARKIVRTALSAGTAIAALGLASPAQSQDAAPSNVQTVETVIVTANKSRARLETVPAALSVIQGSDVSARGISNFEGLVDEVPGVSINYAFGGASSGLL